VDYLGWAAADYQQSQQPTISVYQLVDEVVSNQPTEMNNIESAAFPGWKLTRRNRFFQAD